MNQADREAHRGPPRVWLLLGHKAGDNNQVLALADRLGWPRLEKRIFYRPWELLSNRLLQVTLAGIDRRRSSELRPPWPDLVITSGRRNEPVARWIKREAGGRVKLVHVGRPWAPLVVFDLIVATPQYELPALPTILMNDLPMHPLDQARLAAAGEKWRPALRDLPQPRTAVLLGGNSGAFVFTAAKARRLGELVSELVRPQGGSVLVTDSARTPGEAFDAFLAALDVPCHVHRWGAAEADNPYLAYLELADQFVVTGDSMSMIAEASFAAKPLYLFSLDDGPDWWKRAYNFRFKPLTHRLAMAVGPRRMRRDVNRILDCLIATGRAVRLGERFRAAPDASAGSDKDQLTSAARRVAALFGDAPS